MKPVIKILCMILFLLTTNPVVEVQTADLPTKKLGFSLQLRAIQSDPNEANVAQCFRNDGRNRLAVVHRADDNAGFREVQELTQLDQSATSVTYTTPVLYETLTDYSQQSSVSNFFFLICKAFTSGQYRPNLNDLHTLMFGFRKRSTYSFNCEPCYTERWFVTYRATFRSFPMSATTVYREVHMFINKFIGTYSPTCFVQPACGLNLLTASYCITLNYPLIRISAYLAEDFNANVGLDPVKEMSGRTPLFFLAEDDFPRFIRGNNRIGIGFYQSNGIIPNNCYMDKIALKNINGNAFVPHTFTSEPSERKVFTADAIVYYSAYGFGGRNANFRCNIQNNFTRCTDSETPACGDMYKAGISCTTDTSICSSNPCKNGATCRGVRSNYVCECVPGSFGRDCEFFTCNVSCFNSRCAGPNRCGPCDSGWEGTNCRSKSCSNFTKCMNGGGCQFVNGVRTCICDTTKYFGTYCELECQEKCQHGTCNLILGTPTCTCNQGFVGEDCSLENTKNNLVIKMNRDFYRNVGIICGLFLIAILVIYILQVTVVSATKSSTSFKMATQMSMKMIENQQKTMNQQAGNLGYMQNDGGMAGNEADNYDNAYGNYYSDQNAANANYAAYDNNQNYEYYGGENNAQEADQNYYCVSGQAQ